MCVNQLKTSFAQKKKKKKSVCKRGNMLRKSEGERWSLKPTGMIRSQVNFFKNTRWIEVFVLAKQGRAQAKASANRVGGKRLMHAVRLEWSL